MTTTEPIDTTPVAPPFALEGFETQAIAIRDLHESPKNPRRYFSQKGLEELAASIRVNDVRVALVARPRLEGGGYELAAGHRRYRAAKIAGAEYVPVQVRDLTDAQLVDWLAFENGNREDFNALEEASGWLLWMDENVADVPALIEKTGLKPAYVYGRLKLLEAIPEAQRAFMDGKIKIAHLEDLARIPSPRDQRAALKALEPANWEDPEKIMTTREFKAWIKKNLHADLTQAPFSRTDPTLAPKMGACGPCPHRLGNAEDFDPANDMPEMCMQAECYEQKVIAHTSAAMASLRGSVVFVSEMARTKGDGVLPKGDWHESLNASGGKDALIVEGPRMGRRIRVVVQERIPAATPAPPAPAPWVDKGPGFLQPPARSQAEIDAEEADLREQDERWQREQEEQRKQRAAEKQTRIAIARALLDKVKWPPRKEDVLAMVEESSLAEVPEMLEEIMQHEFGVRAFPDFDLLSDAQAARLVVLLAIMNDFDEWSLNHGCDALHAAAKRYGVDVAKIRDKAKEAEGGTRKEVLKKLPALGEKPKAAPAKKAAAKKSVPAKKAAPVKKKVIAKKSKGDKK
jgi:ParB/RepB/Spo0J family partition protein